MTIHFVRQGQLAVSFTTGMALSDSWRLNKYWGQKNHDEWCSWSKMNDLDSLPK